jgi:hypothetical protein
MQTAPHEALLRRAKLKGCHPGRSGRSGRSGSPVGEYNRHFRFTPKSGHTLGESRQCVRVMRQSVAVCSRAQRAPRSGLWLFPSGAWLSPFRSSRPSLFPSRRGLRRHLLAPLIDQLLLGAGIFIEVEIAVAVARNAVAFTMLCVLPEPPLRECRFWPAWRT